MTLSGPPINTTVTVDVAGWVAPRRTRVEDLDDDIVVAAPVPEGDDHEPSLGASLEVAWQGVRGPISQQARLVAKELRTVPTWRLEPMGPIVITQRRHHVRAGTIMPVVLRSRSGHIDAHVVDLSEGGLRAVTRDDVPLAVGDRLRVELELDERRLALASEVVRMETDGSRWFAGCRFTEIANGDADTLRRFVFDRQARERVR